MPNYGVLNAFDNTLDAICITDTDFMIADSNPSFQNIIVMLGVEVFKQRPVFINEKGFVSHSIFSNIIHLIRQQQSLAK